MSPSHPHIALACPRCLKALIAVDGEKQCTSCPSQMEGAWCRLVVFGPTDHERASGERLSLPPQEAVFARAGGSLAQGAWTFFVPVLAGKAVLSLEVGLGSASLAAANQDPEHLYCLQPDETVAAATAELARRRRIPSVTVIAFSGGEHLPFANACFDVVAIHGLEALSARQGYPWSNARALLREASRVLKPDGAIYLDGTTVGFRDRVARISRASFGVGRTALGLWLHGRRPTSVLRQWQVEGSAYACGPVLRRASLLTDLKSVAGAVLGGARFAVVGGAAGDTLLDRILAQIPAAGSARDARLHFGSGSAYRVETPRHIIRLPRSEDGLKRCRNGFSALQGLEKLGLSFQTPVPVMEAVVAHQPLFVETRIAGAEIPYLRLRRRQILDLADEAFGMLMEITQASRCRIPFTRPLFHSLCGEPLERLAKAVGAPEPASLLSQASAFLEERLLGRPIDLVLVHGDFKVSNLVRDESHRAAGLVDWDFSQAAGLPGSDLLLYRGFDRVLLSGESLGQAILDTALSQPEHDPQIVRYRENLALDDLQWKACALLTLVRYLLQHRSVEQQSLPDLPPARLAQLLVDACRRLMA